MTTTSTIHLYITSYDTCKSLVSSTKPLSSTQTKKAPMRQGIQDLVSDKRHLRQKDKGPLCALSSLTSRCTVYMEKIPCRHDVYRHIGLLSYLDNTAARVHLRSYTTTIDSSSFSISKLELYESRNSCPANQIYTTRKASAPVHQSKPTPWKKQ